MRLLLDSHTLLWWLNDHPNLPKSAREIIADPSNEPLASVISAYELAYKSALGKLDQLVPVELPDLLRRAGIPALPLALDVALAAAALPGPHRDPWDRLLIAQAKAERLAVVTRDAVFARYGLETIW